MAYSSERNDVCVCVYYGDYDREALCCPWVFQIYIICIQDVNLVKIASKRPTNANSVKKNASAHETDANRNLFCVNI